MYLSKIILDVRHPSARQALRDVNDMHRNLMAGFDIPAAQGAPRAENHVLYRLFSNREQVYLLVSSAVRPDPRALSARGYHTEDAMIRDVSALEGVLVNGKRLRFELLASPCKKVDAGGKNSRREFLKTPEERMAWLCRKGEQGGFQVLVADEISGRVDVCGRRGAMPIKNSAVLFSGTLRVTDQQTFWQSYVNGIGPGKAYGMGMLNLANA